MSRKAFKFRLYPTKKQEQTLFWTLARCRELYNAALSERKDSYQAHQRTQVRQNTETGQVVAAMMVARRPVKSVTYLQQKRDLPEIKAELREEYQDIHSQVLQDVLLRLARAFQNFFRRIENGQTPGFPRFQGRNRYNSFTYPQGGYSLTHDSRVCLSKIGEISVKLHREMEGTIKTATVKYEAGQWYIVFSCEGEQPEPLPKVQSEIGIDLGVTHFAALSDSTFIESPRYWHRCRTAVSFVPHSVSLFGILCPFSGLT